MYRILKPSGFLFFTAAGYQAVLYREKGDRNRSDNPDNFKNLLNLDSKGFFFYPAYEKKGKAYEKKEEGFWILTIGA